MKNLELYAPYLPYKAEIIVTHCTNGTNLNPILKPIGAYKTILNWNNIPDLVNDCAKIYLLPLTYLIKINPETNRPFYMDVISKSCPLPFLGKNNKHWKPLFTGTRQVSTADDLDKWLYLEIDNHYNDFSFSIDLLTGDLTTYRNGELATTDNQAAYIQELYKYHFDVNDLLNQGLALLKA